jgi:DNA transposition AAA+ family ATPase
VERVKQRRDNLPGMAAFYGKSGVGKSTAAAYAANKHKAYYVQVKAAWTRKYLCQMVLGQMGITPEKTLAEMVDQIAEQLTKSKRPLIVDEADFLVQKGMIEIIRDIYESSFATIILIGEENLPRTLKKWERVHNRMLDWVKAQPCDLSDCKQLARIFCPGVTVADELLIRVKDAVGGCTRRIAVNLDHIFEFSQGHRLQEVTVANYAHPIDTGMPGRG